MPEYRSAPDPRNGGFDIERSLEILSQGGAYMKERVTIAEKFKL